jgi:regulator of replication initiation timing
MEPTPSASDEVAQLRLVIQKLQKDNRDLMTENLKLREDNTKLGDEVNGLKTKIQIEKPLVKVGVAVRLQFW